MCSQCQCLPRVDRARLSTFDCTTASTTHSSHGLERDTSPPSPCASRPSATTLLPAHHSSYVRNTPSQPQTNMSCNNEEIDIAFEDDASDGDEGSTTVNVSDSFVVIPSGRLICAFLGRMPAVPRPRRINAPPQTRRRTASTRTQWCFCKCIISRCV